MVREIWLIIGLTSTIGVFKSYTYLLRVRKKLPEVTWAILTTPPPSHVTAKRWAAGIAECCQDSIQALQLASTDCQTHGKLAVEKYWLLPLPNAVKKGNFKNRTYYKM